MNRVLVSEDGRGISVFSRIAGLDRGGVRARDIVVADGIAFATLRQAGGTTSHSTKPASGQVAGYQGERNKTALP